jgi:hypothetical protein
MDTPIRPNEDALLYARDFHAWCESQARRLRELGELGRGDGLDYEHLVEEIEGLAGRDRREVKSRLRLVLSHLLKWRHQPDRQGPSWRSTLIEQRHELAGIFEQSPSLRPFAQSSIADVYPKAAREASAETGLDIRAFPQECPFSFEEMLDDTFLPADLEGSSGS